MFRILKLAAMLPSKTIPLTSSGATKRRTHGKSKKRKARSTTDTSKSKKLRATIENEEPVDGLANSSELPASIITPLHSSSLGRTSSMGSVSSTVKYDFFVFLICGWLPFRWIKKKTSYIFSMSPSMSIAMVRQSLDTNTTSASTVLVKHSSSHLPWNTI